MKKLLLLPLFAWLSFSLAFSQERKMEIYEVNTLADVVLYGEITSTKGKNFTLSVQEVVAGDFSEKEIAVGKVKNSSTAKRWGKYTVGEVVMVFLVNNDGAWKVVGKNGEGEKLISGETAYLDSRGGGLKNSFGYHQVNATVNIYAEKADLKELCSALKDTKSCYTIETEEKKDRAGLPFVARYAVQSTELDEAAMDKLRSSSNFHNLIISIAEKHFRP